MNVKELFEELEEYIGEYEPEMPINVIGIGEEGEELELTVYEVREIAGKLWLELEVV